MQFLRRHYQFVIAALLGPLGIFLATTVATAGENWAP
jgi:hypothetical protein